MLRVLGSFVAGLIKAIVPNVIAYAAGKGKARQEQAEDAAKIKDKQLRAASRRRATRGDILERMRRGDL